MTHIPYRNPYRYVIDVRSPISMYHIDLRCTISISHIDIPIISCHCDGYGSAWSHVSPGGGAGSEGGTLRWCLLTHSLRNCLSTSLSEPWLGRAPPLARSAPARGRGPPSGFQYIQGECPVRCVLASRWRLARETPTAAFTGRRRGIARRRTSESPAGHTSHALILHPFAVAHTYHPPYPRFYAPFGTLCLHMILASETWLSEHDNPY